MIGCKKAVSTDGVLTIGNMSLFLTDAQLEQIAVAIAEYFAAKPIELGPAALCNH